MELYYPSFFPDLRFLGSISLVTLANYYFNRSTIADKWKYLFTAICFIMVLLIPIPFFAADRNFGAVPLSPNDYRGYVPFTLLYLVAMIFRYYSLQIELIKGKKEPPGPAFACLFMFYLPYYLYDPSMKNKRTSETDHYHWKKMFMIIGTFVAGWLLTIIIFNFLPIKIPKAIFHCCFSGYWWIPIIIGSGIATIIMFIMISTIVSFMSAFYNIFGKFNFKYYSDKPFLSTSISEFWRKWNLWTDDWFFTYLYRPLRRKYKFTHTQAILTIFTFSGLVHAYCIAMINWSHAWIAFFVFFINGVAIQIETFVIKRFPIVSKTPKPVKFILTFSYLVIIMGIFGLCFSK